MIVNLKHLKKQWSGLNTSGLTSLGFSSANPCQILQAFTAAQLWLQLVSLLLVLYSCLDRRYLTQDDVENPKNYPPTGYENAYFTGSLVFQVIDIFVTVYASCHLRNASTMYHYVLQVNIWAMANNIYLTTSIMCFIYIFSRSKSFVIWIRLTTTCLFAVCKTYIVYQLYKNERSSSVFLEQKYKRMEKAEKQLKNEKKKESSENHPNDTVVVELTTIYHTETKDNEIPMLERSPPETESSNNNNSFLDKKLSNISE